MIHFEYLDIEKMVADGNIEGLLQAVDTSQSAEVRKAALEALGDTRDKRAEKVLRAALTDPDKMVSGAATVALLRYSLANAPAARKRRAETGDPFKFRRLKIATFVVGAIVVAVCLVIMFSAAANGDADSPSLLTIIGVIVPVALIYFLGMAGWDWELRNNPYSRQTKAFLFAIIAISIIGLIPISYWVGKTVMEKVFR